MTDTVPDQLVGRSVAGCLESEEQTRVECLLQEVDQPQSVRRHGKERRLGGAGVLPTRERHVVLQHGTINIKLASSVSYMVTSTSISTCFPGIKFYSVALPKTGMHAVSFVATYGHVCNFV